MAADRAHRPDAHRSTGSGNTGPDFDSDTGPGHQVILLSRVGCHLCDDARAVVASVCGERGLGWEELDVDANDELQAEYGDLVPVVLVDGVEQGYLRIDADELRAALRG